MIGFRIRFGEHLIFCCMCVCHRISFLCQHKRRLPPWWWRDGKKYRYDLVGACWRWCGCIFAVVKLPTRLVTGKSSRVDSRETARQRSYHFDLSSTFLQLWLIFVQHGRSLKAGHHPVLAKKARNHWRDTSFRNILWQCCSLQNAVQNWGNQKFLFPQTCKFLLSCS